MQLHNEHLTIYTHVQCHVHVNDAHVVQEGKMNTCINRHTCTHNFPSVYKHTTYMYICVWVHIKYYVQGHTQVVVCNNKQNTFEFTHTADYS